MTFRGAAMAARVWSGGGSTVRYGVVIALVAVCFLAAVALRVRSSGSAAALYGVGGEDWWNSQAYDRLVTPQA